MITLPPHRAARIDAAVDDALDRLRDRATRRSAIGGDLAAAAARAARDGKRLRPALVVASFEAFAPDAIEQTPALWQVAAAFELLHTAFVVHDDLIDRDTQRRGVPNVSGEYRKRGLDLGAAPEQAILFGDAAAVLAGDLLLFEASRLIATAPVDTLTRDDLFSVLEDAVGWSAAGELADVAHAVAAEDPEPDALLAAAHDKTAVYSFRAPLAAGAALAAADPAARAAAERAISPVGLAFQLVDDLIGAFGTATQAGREPGADLRERKRTPLIAFAQQSASWPHVDSALGVAATGPVAVLRAQRALDASGARERIAGLVDDLLAHAHDLAADPAIPAPVSALIRGIAARVTERIP
ncbi:polyprenyl synthetase family protein [Microbacterium sp.]|uniref:polyprenyl synthetase family protein n=1 Tax=Microbacterium sp. TaxID=51671 RepID=UPI003A88925D